MKNLDCIVGVIGDKAQSILKESPPKITITATLSQSDEEELGDELATVSTWLIELKKPYKVC